jgi:hypothetical protein
MHLSLLAQVALSAFAFAFADRPQPDKYWLEPAPAGQTVEGSQPAMIEGVLLDESATHFHLRVVGGEIWLAKNAVHHVEKDGLDVAAIEKREQEAKGKPAPAPQGKPADASAKKDAPQGKDAPPAPKGNVPAPASPSAPATPASQAAKNEFDPVLGVVGPAKAKPQSREAELEAEWHRTGDREVLKELRRARRGH